MSDRKDRNEQDEQDESTPLLTAHLKQETNGNSKDTSSTAAQNGNSAAHEISILFDLQDEESAAQQTPQSASSSLLSSTNGQVKCWACWESSNSYRNPLIRVCLHCKDPDLQYIHQSCINSYISSLPLPRRPRSPRLNQLQNQDNEQEQVQEPTQTVAEFLSQDQVLYDCTRCRDPYTVSTVPISPLEVIWMDVWMRSIAIVLFLGFLVMASTLAVIAANAYWGQDVVLFSVWGVEVSALTIAAFLTVLGMGAGGSLMVAMWTASMGRTRLWVTGVRLGETQEA